MIVFDKKFQEQELGAVVRELRQHLESCPEYTVWLDAPMGAGKSTLVRHYLWGLGLPAAESVPSPTFTIMNEYKIGPSWYAHLDLYRAGPTFSFDELGVDAKPYKGIFMEWFDIVGSIPSIQLTHRLRLTILAEHERHIQLEKL